MTLFNQWCVAGSVKILEEHETYRTIDPGQPVYHSPVIQQLVIDRAAYMVYLGQSRISFPKKEFELLLLLASNPKKVFKREEILFQIWGTNYKPKDSRSLDVHIRMLRRKLGEAFISTVRGVGYKLEK